MEPVQKGRAKKYNNIKLAGGIIKSIVTFLLLLHFVYSGWSGYLNFTIAGFVPHPYLRLVVFTLFTGFVMSVLFFPAAYYLEYYLEHKFSLSNQTFFKWIWKDLKESLVGSAVGIPILLLFYWVLRGAGELWWLPFSILLFFISVLLAKVAPVVILPLFYKITPLEKPELKERIVKLAGEAGMKVENVYLFNMSKNTKKANAAFTGLGSTKRILLGDTLVNNFTPDEIETVIAHELGHYKRRHIIKNIILGALFSFLTFFLAAKLYDFSLPYFGFKFRDDIGALPLLLLWGMVIGTLQTPLSNWISRRFEYEADENAVRASGKKEAFASSLLKLTEQNLADSEPHPFVEWFFYSHPSIGKRVRFIKSISPLS